MDSKKKMEFINEMRILMASSGVGGSDRVRDNLRKTMKRVGLIEFDRKTWRWSVTTEGLKFMENDNAAKV